MGLSKAVITRSRHDTPLPSRDRTRTWSPHAAGQPRSAADYLRQLPATSVIICRRIVIHVVSLDRVFELLRKERRRYALYYLEQQDGPVPIDEVAEKVAEWETDGVRASIPEELFERVECSLRHTDLPKASEAEYIEYDPKEGVVEVTGTPPEVDAILTVAKVIERPDRNP